MRTWLRSNFLIDQKRDQQMVSNVVLMLTMVQLMLREQALEKENFQVAQIYRRKKE